MRLRPCFRCLTARAPLTTAGALCPPPLAPIATCCLPPSPLPPLPAAGEVQDEMNAVRALRGDFGAFSGGKPASAEALADSKRLTGTFLGARGAGTSAAKASAAAKEE